MPEGPGKYDDLATLARELTSAKAVAILVIDGVRGTGFSVQVLSRTAFKAMPEILRAIADQIEKDSE